jgi:hypothetical protein
MKISKIQQSIRERFRQIAHDNSQSYEIDQPPENQACSPSVGVERASFISERPKVKLEELPNEIIRYIGSFLPE